MSRNNHIFKMSQIWVGLVKDKNSRDGSFQGMTKWYFLFVDLKALVGSKVLKVKKSLQYGKILPMV